MFKLKDSLREIDMGDYGFLGASSGSGSSSEKSSIRKTSRAKTESQKKKKKKKKSSYKSSDSHTPIDNSYAISLITSGII